MIGAELKAHVLNWLGGLSKLVRRGNALPTVDESTALARARTCEGCPHHHHITGGCSTCKRAVTGLRTAVLGNRRPPELRLGGCAIIGHDCLTAAVLDEPKLGAANLPDHCWRR